MSVISKVKHVAWQTAQTSAFSTVTDALERVGEPNIYLLRVLTYHRVAEPEAYADLYPGLISATPDAFQRQMAYLAANCYALSMPELLEILRAGEILPPRSVLVTFDDGYRDFADVAWPILQKYEIPATLFVPTGYPDNPGRSFFWDRIYTAIRSASDGSAVETPIGPMPVATPADRGRTCHRLNQYFKSLPDTEAAAFLDDLCLRLGATMPPGQSLGWEELRQLAREGLTIGSHSRNHQIMTRIPPEEMRADIRQSFEDLDREIGDTPRIFAYPAGMLDDVVLSVMAEESVELAFTTERGINDIRRLDALQVRRIHVGQRTTLPILRAQLAPVAMSVGRWLD